jgi:ATP-dependent Lhr-like helicase
LQRHGVVNRETVAVENTPGGFGTIYPVLVGMEEAGRIRRGYFVSGLGATQFALPGALDLLRSLREARPREASEVQLVVLAATDPANPYGVMLKWPGAGVDEAGRAPSRSVGATVLLANGALAAFLARGDRVWSTWIPATEPERSWVAQAVARALIDRARQGDPPRGMLIEEIDGRPAPAHPLAPFLVEAGFLPGPLGLQATFPQRIPGPARSHPGR